MSGAQHLYLHLPFCSSRCGYCDFVTVVGRSADHAGYVGALLQELALERDHLAPELETIYLGGGTPTFTEPDALEHLLHALPGCDELTVEANPETVTSELAALLARNRVDRVSIGAQSFHTRLLDVLERRATPEDVRRAVHRLRDAGIGNISIDLIYGIPGEKPADLARDLAEIVELAPEHVSAYELEAKPGTRFTHAHGDELAQQAEALEGSFEAVVDALTGAGYRWYETANFCLDMERAGGRDLRARHNLGYWRGEDYLGIGVGAVSTIENRRWRNAPSLTRYLAALAEGQTPPRDVEPLALDVKAVERVMLGLRLDEPLPLGDLGSVLDGSEVEQLERLGLVARHEDGLVLTRRGRFVGGAVTARVLV
ncbi:MAG TPA: radical SAM family heme chaperone HemW [Gaiellaceae bacterium]|nr:radical SAM family heme chaperone HemW [Gaiellaceae bacterium]